MSFDQTPMKSIFALAIASLACFALAAPQDGGDDSQAITDDPFFPIEETEEMIPTTNALPRPPFSARPFICPNLKLCQDPSIRALQLTFQNIGPSGVVCVYDDGSSCLIGASGAVCVLNGRVFQGNVIQATGLGPRVIGC